jgi:hypothetical protein
MSARSRQELYDIIKNEIQSGNESLTDFSEGSILDCIAGAASTAISESMGLIVDQFKKTFIDLAGGPAETGGPDDIQDLAVDHFGDEFARPDAQPAVGIVIFSRTSAAAGDVLIAAGTIVKTPLDSNGQSIRFKTLLDVTMIGTSVNASVEAVEAGVAGNVAEGKATLIESTLLDPTIKVTNDAEFSGGAAEQDTPTYRKTIKNLIRQLKGATIAAIKAKALTVSGVVQATPVEEVIRVIQWDDATESPSGLSFLIPRAKLYISDANGTANSALLANVASSIKSVRAGGVRVDVAAAVAYALDWSAQYTLNPAGPNYESLQDDSSLITEAMAKYIDAIPTGLGFDRISANTAMLAVFGPAGTNDITDFLTNAPTGSIAGVAGQKLISGTMSIN